MSKTKERALEAYPVVMTTLIPADEEHPLIEQDCNKFTREAYLKGYHQAEEDNKLTWEDIKEICVQSVLVEIDLGGLVSDERHYSEVLKRFKEKKEK